MDRVDRLRMTLIILVLDPIGLNDVHLENLVVMGRGVTGMEKSS